MCTKVESHDSNESTASTESFSSPPPSPPPDFVMSVGFLQPYNKDTDDFVMWVAQFRSFLMANKLDTTKETERCRSIFLSCLNLPTYTLLTTLLAPTDPNTKELDDLIQTLSEHFQPAPKALAERFKFTSRHQRAGETVAQFTAELRSLATACKFKDLEERIRDQFIFGLSSESAQKRLFTRDDDMKFSEAIQVATAQEMAEASTQLIRGGQQFSSHPPSHEPVNKTSHDKQKKWKNTKTPQQQHHGGKGKNSSVNSTPSTASCPNCGSNQHATARECPHKNVKCHSCGKKGHFAKLCRSNAQAANNVEIYDISKVNPSDKKQIIRMKTCISGKQHDMELDTACGKATLSIDFWKGIGSPPLQKSNIVFRSYTNNLFYPIGELTTTIEYNNQSIEHSIPVVKGSSLFGRDLLQLFENIDWKDIDFQRKSKSNNRNTNVKQVSATDSLIKEFSDVFSMPTASDRIRHFKAKVVLREDAQPKYLKARDVPYALVDAVNHELDLMEETGVIEKIPHSDWASPLVVVPKGNGRVRITGDFKNTVNSQLCVTQYPLALPEDLFVKISGGNKFSKLDGSNAYHQLELDESSRHFLVINTHRGLYRYTVLPQGISSSPAIFQECMDTMLQGIPKTGSFIDDMITTGITDAAHEQNLREILTRMRKFNYKLNKEKCNITEDVLTFLGHRISKAGIETCPKKVGAILSIPEPRNVSELSAYLGFANFYGKFMPEFGKVCEPLYELRRDDVDWKWSQKCRVAFNTVKQLLTTSPILSHFQPNLPIGIATDASSTAIGMVLFHKYPDGSERPLSFASKVLSETQRRYSQVEKEGLGIILGIQKYFKFLCGRKFLLVTDAKPLLTIFGPKTKLPAYAATRLHHWAVYLSQFSYDIVYRKTSDHGNADALSRVPKATAEQPAQLNTEIIVNSITVGQVDILPVTAQQIRIATSRDVSLARVIRYHEGGWPEQLSQSDRHLQLYFHHRHELLTNQGVLLWGVRVVIPEKFRNTILQQLHTCHMGIVKMKMLARQHVWWPNIDTDIEALAKSCQHCQQNAATPASAPLHPWQYPEREWQRLHVDLAGPFLGQMWLLIVDARTKWPEIFPMGNNTTSAAVKAKFMEVFSRFGLPHQVVSDNGRQFVSEDFSRFLKTNGVKHIFSSVYHPRSNGEAERLVRTFKEGMKGERGQPSEKVLQQFLFQYRTTPHSTTGVSPAELLIGRKLRTTLDLLYPGVEMNVALAQANQEQQFNQRVKLRELSPDKPVWVRTYSKNAEKWSLGTAKRAIGPVTYEVDVGGSILKRHVDQLRSAFTSIEQSPLVSAPPPGTPGSAQAASATRNPQTDLPVVENTAVSPHGSGRASSAVSTPQAPPQAPPEKLQDTATPAARPKRSRQPPKRLQYNRKGENV